MEWEAHNPNGFQYGQGGKFMRHDADSSQLSSAPPGGHFVNRYSTSAITEDKAEVRVSRYSHARTPCRNRAAGAWGMGEKRASVPVSSVWEALAAELLCALGFFFGAALELALDCPRHWTRWAWKWNQRGRWRICPLVPPRTDASPPTPSAVTEAGDASCPQVWAALMCYDVVLHSPQLRGKARLLRERVACLCAQMDTHWWERVREAQATKTNLWERHERGQDGGGFLHFLTGEYVKDTPEVFSLDAA